jgi:hypothetical protein
VRLCDKAEKDEAIKRRVKQSGLKHPAKGFKYGADYNRYLNKNVDRAMNIDRKNDEYYERIVNRELEELIHECSESLKNYYGQGNAKGTTPTKEG